MPIDKLKKPLVSKPVKNYAKNIFKSLKFASIDYIKDSLPSVVEFTENNSELFKDIYTSLRDFKNTMKRTKDIINKSPIMRMANEFLDNAKKDLKTGQFINNDRKTSMVGDAMSDGGDFDFGHNPFSDSNDSEFSMEFETGTSSSDKGISANRIDSQQIVGAISESAKSNLASIEYLAENQKSINNINIALYTSKLNEMNFHLSNISANIGGILNFYNTNMNKYFENSYTYFEQMSMAQKELLNLMKSQHDMLYTNSISSSAENSEDDIFTAGGSINIKGYLNNIKKNIKNYISENAMGMDAILGSMSEFGDKPNFIISPLGMIPRKMVEKIIPKVLKESMDNFNKSFSNFFKSLILKFSRNKGSDGPLGFLSEIFGLKNEKKELNLSEYKKGPVPFDGITRKSIIEVIPTYLRKILSALTGEKEKVYNYETASYEDLDVKKKSYKKSIDSMYDSSVYGTKSKIDELLGKTYKFSSKEEKEAFDSDISKIFKVLIDRGVLFKPKKDTFDRFSELGIDMDLKTKSSFDAFVAAFDSLKTNEKFNFNDEMIQAIKNRNMVIEDLRNKMETQGISNAMSDWSPIQDDKDIKKNIKRVGQYEDKFGETTQSYLRKILELLYNGIIVYPTRGIRGKTDVPKHIKDGLVVLRKPQLEIDEQERNKEKLKNDEEREYLLSADQSALKNNQILINQIEDMGDTDEIKERIKEANRVVEETGGSRPKLIQRLMKIRDLPGKIIASAFNSLDNLMYKIIYGGSVDKDGNPKSGESEGVIKTIVNNMKEIFRISILDPLDDKLFNEKTGIITKLKVNLKDSWKNISSSLMKGIFGEDFSLKTQGKSIWYKIRLGINNILFGTADRNESGKFQKSKKGLLSGLQDKFYIYFNELSSTLWGGKEGYSDTYGKEYKDQRFGGQKKFKKFKEDLQQKFKERFPDMAIGGGLGLIGSFFLPGGPIFGTLLGTGIGFARRSETIKKFLFGEEIDDVDDKGNAIKVRKGNKVFSQKFMKKFKTEIQPMIPGIKTGMGIGGLSSLLLGFGPVTGLLLGGAVSWAKQSESFKKYLFGGNDKDGNYKEGLFNKDLKEKIKKFIPSMGKGAGLGLMSSLMLGLGPLAGILAGGSLGFISELDFVKDKIFGKPDEKGERHGGWIDQLKILANDSILKPIKKAIFGDKDNENKNKQKGFIGHIKDWFKESISDPFKAAMKPFVEEMKIVGRSIADIFKDTFNSVFENAVGKPLGELIKEKVVDPMKKFLGKLIGGIGRFFGKIISSPFKMFAAMAGGMAKDHLRSGVTDRKGERVSKYLDNMTDEQLDILRLNRKQVDAYNKEDKVSGFEAIKRWSTKIFGGTHQKLKKDTEKIQGKVKNFLDGLFKKDKDHISLSEKFRIWMVAGEGQQTFGDKLREGWKRAFNNFTSSFNIHAKNEKDKSDIEKKAAEVAKNVEETKIKIDPTATPQSSTDNIDKSDKKESKTMKISKGDTDITSKKGKSIISMIRNIEKYTGIASKEVRGQLDGVGYNVEKIKNILKNSFGDADATGLKTERGNKKRRGFFGKLWDFLQNPMNFLKNVVTAPFKFIGNLLKDSFKPFMETLGQAANAILNIPQYIVKIIGDGFNLIVNGVKFVFDTTTNLLNTSVNLIMSSLEGLANVVVGIGEGLGSIFSSLGSVVNTAISAVSELALEAIPKLIKGIGSLFELIGGGLKWLGRGIASIFSGKKKKEIVGSKVNSVKTVKEVELIKKIDRVDSVGVIDKINNEVKVHILGGNLDSSPEILGLMKQQINILKSTKKNKTKKDISEQIVDNINEDSNINAIGINSSDRKKITGVKSIRKNQKYVLNERAKEALQKTQQNMAENIQKTAESSQKTAEHMGSAFGKKGIFSGLLGLFNSIKGAIIAIPSILIAIKLVKEGIDWIKQVIPVWNAGIGDDNGDGIANADFNKDGNVTFVERGAYSVGKGTINYIKQNPRGAAQAILKSKPGKKIASKIGMAVLKPVAKSAAKVTKKAVGKVVQKVAASGIMKVIKEFIEKIIKIVVKKFPKLSKFGGKILSKLVGALAKSGSKILAKIGAKCSAALASGGLVTAAFALNDVVTGMLDVRNIFQLPPDSPVTWKMRAATGVAKLISGLLMDLPSLIGWDYKYISEFIYGILGNDEELEQLHSSQDEFKADYDAAIASGEYTGSFEDYNKEKNKTAWRKVGGALGSAGKWVGNAAKDAAQWVGTAAKNTGKWVGNAAKNVAKAGKWMWDRSLVGGMTDNVTRQRLGLNEDAKITTGARISSGLGGMIEKFTFGKVKAEDTSKMIIGIFTTIKDSVLKPIGNFFKNTFDKLKEGVQNIFKFLHTTFIQPWIDRFNWINDNIFKPIGDFFKSGWLKEHIFQPIGNFFQEKLIQPWVDRFNWLNDNIFKPIGDFFKSGWIKENIITPLANGIKEHIIQPIADKFTWIKENVFKPIANFFTAIFGGGEDNKKGFFAKVGDFFTSKGQQEINALNNELSGSGKKTSKIARLSGKGDSEGIVNNIPYYSQKDSEWAAESYSGTETIGSTGCAPTAAAMVISSITGKRITPKDTAQFAKDGSYDFKQAGTSYTYITDVLTQYGIESTMYERPIPRNDIKKALNSHKLVILLGRGSKDPFTDDGHFIVATSVTATSIFINDPLDKARSKLYNFNQVMDDTEVAWLIESSNASSFDPMGDFGNSLQMIIETMLGINKDVGGEIKPVSSSSTYTPLTAVQVAKAAADKAATSQLSSSAEIAKEQAARAAHKKTEEALFHQTNYNTDNIKQGEKYIASDGVTEYIKMTAPNVEGKLVYGTNETLINRLSRLGKDNKKNIDLTSSYRSFEHQENLRKLYEEGKGNQAAKPGNSAHNFGLAVDVRSPWVKKLTDNDLKEYKLWKPAKGEDWHVEPIETDGNRNKDKYPNVFPLLTGAGRVSRGKVQKLQNGSYGLGTTTSTNTYSISSSAPILSTEIFDEILKVLQSIANNTEKASENKVTIVVDKKESVEKKNRSNDKFTNNFLNIIEKNKAKDTDIDYENAIIIANGTY